MIVWLPINSFLISPRDAQDLRHNFLERKHAVGETGVCHRSRHTPNHTRRLILYQDPGPACTSEFLPHADHPAPCRSG